MASNQEKAQCVVWFAESKSVTTVQRQYRQRYGKEPPSNPALGQVSFWKQAAFVTCPEVDAQGCLKSPLNLFRKQSNEVPESLFALNQWSFIYLRHPYTEYSIKY
ncbi:putative Helix-turn-helix domain-containing protein 3 [Homarus americanus]|uniref:Putative Helix-turn-helix domain-containing protein 3 n=1 Tax=Homarus americanus TaxID=6706 RepID=A0A8J5JN61_HOMAM|nr:putative Helix-turn-helix domain-containing protein 3 [Homarus americanus]